VKDSIRKTAKKQECSIGGLPVFKVFIEKQVSDYYDWVFVSPPTLSL
jgi:hypothetical protein